MRRDALWREIDWRYWGKLQLTREYVDLCIWGSIYITTPILLDYRGGNLIQSHGFAKKRPKTTLSTFELWIKWFFRCTDSWQKRLPCGKNRKIIRLVKADTFLPAVHRTYFRNGISSLRWPGWQWDGNNCPGTYAVGKTWVNPQNDEWKIEKEQKQRMKQLQKEEKE